MKKNKTWQQGRWAGLSLALLIAGGLVALSYWNHLSADLAAPKPADRQVSQTVATLLETEHLSNKQLDDQISQRALELFLEALDPMKVYFYQADVDGFSKRRDELDTMVIEGDISFAYTVHNRFQQRIQERMVTVDRLLQEEHDFTVDETMIREPDMLQFPRTQEADERWRKRIKFDLLMLKVDKTEGEEAKERLRQRYHSFANRMRKTSSDELLEIFLTSVTTAFDPHTTYMSPSTLENFRILMRLNLEGIGAALQLKDGYTQVTKIIPGGAADKHGKLKVNDRIVAVGQGKSGESVDTIDMKLSDVVDMIRGKAGTLVRLRILPADGGETRTYTITRAKIELTDSEARGKILEKTESTSGNKYRLGVIDLPSFYMDMEAARQGRTDFKSTTRDVRKILENFRRERVDAVVLDLRRNGGGSLTEAINLTGLFIDFGPVVQVKDPDGDVRYYNDVDRQMLWKGPLVVLTSKLSASASEILAGAIKDYRRGLIVGDESTHGKGTVQSLLDLGGQVLQVPNPPNLGALKLTMQQFYRPNGASTQKKGVVSDIVLPSIINHMDISEADLDFAIDFDRVDPARYFDYRMTSEPIITKLRRQSAERRRASEDFQRLERNIARYREQKARKYITLNEKTFFAQRAELNADKEDEKLIEDQNNQSDEIFPKGYYNDETIAITLDYLQQLGSHRVAEAQ